MKSVSTAVLAAAAVLIAACSSPQATSVAPPSNGSFDLGRVQAAWRARCIDGQVTDPALCDQLRIQDFSADGDVLIVATTLDPSDQTRAAVICAIVAATRSFSDGTAIGFKVVEVRDIADGTLAACPDG